MAYRASAAEPKTAWARHLDRVRRERDWSATKMFEESRVALRLGAKSRSAFLPLLADEEPTEAQAAALTELYGAPTDQDREATRTLGPTLEERHVIALERAAAAAEAQVEATYAQTAMMRLLFTQIAGLAAPDDDDDDAVVRRTDDALRRRRSGLAPIGA